MNTQLTHAARIELARSLRRHYQASSSRAKKQILEEFEPPRDSRRLHFLRGLEHGKTESIFT
jgi:hypothetical protein